MPPPGTKGSVRRGGTPYVNASKTSRKVRASIHFVGLWVGFRRTLRLRHLPHYRFERCAQRLTENLPLFCQIHITS